MQWYTVKVGIGEREGELSQTLVYHRFNSECMSCFHDPHCLVLCDREVSSDYARCIAENSLA